MHCVGYRIATAVAGSGPFWTLKQDGPILLLLHVGALFCSCALLRSVRAMWIFSSTARPPLCVVLSVT